MEMGSGGNGALVERGAAGERGHRCEGGGELKAKAEEKLSARGVEQRLEESKREMVETRQKRITWKKKRTTIGEIVNVQWNLCRLHWTRKFAPELILADRKRRWSLTLTILKSHVQSTANN